MRWFILYNLVACGGGDADSPATGDTGPADADADSDADADADVDTDADSDADADTDVTTDTGPTTDLVGPAITGTLVGPDGAPLPAYDVLCCSEVTCYQQATDATGRFVFTVDPDTDWVVKTHEDDDRDPRWAATMAPARVTGVDVARLGEVFVPDLPEGAALASGSAQQVLAVGDGLTLTVVKTNLKADFGVFLQDLAARSILPEHQPVLDELAGAPVLAMYALFPFHTTSTAPIPVQVTTTLPAGATATLYTLDLLDGRLSAPVAATSDGAALISEPGQGITDLTWLVITTP